MKLKQAVEIEVYPNELEESYTWYEAVKVCEALGDGWRLPTKEELNLSFLNKDKIGGFGADCYWSSSEANSSNAWGQNFGSGYQHCNNKNVKYLVRPVRGFSNSTVEESLERCLD